MKIIKGVNINKNMKKVIKLNEWYYVCGECGNQEFEVEHTEKYISLYCQKCGNRKTIKLEDL